MRWFKKKNRTSWVIQRDGADFFTYSQHLEAAIRLRELRFSYPRFKWQLIEREEIR